MPSVLCSALLVSFPWSSHFPFLPKLNGDLIHSIISSSSAIVVLLETENHGNIIITGFLVSKETVVLRRWGRETKIGFYQKS